MVISTIKSKSPTDLKAWGLKMIREELRKEIEKEAKRRTQGFRNQENCIQSYIMGATDFARKEISNPEMNLELFLLKDKDDVIYGYLEVDKDFDIMKLKDMTLTEAISYLLENKIAIRSRTGYPPTLHFKES